VELPFAAALIEAGGSRKALVTLGGLAFLMLPLASCLNYDRPSHLLPSAPPPSALDPYHWLLVIRTVLRHRDFHLLSLSFFVCGFHVVFISLHLVAYLQGQ